MKFSFAPKRLAMVSGVMICALGTGHLMQSVFVGDKNPGFSGVAVASVSSQVYSTRSDTKSDVSAEETFLPETGDVGSDAEKLETLDGKLVDDVVLTSALPSAPAAVDRPVALPDDPVEIVALSDAPISDLPTEEKAPTFGCDIKLDVQAQQAAMAMLELSAGCLANARFTMHHSGMMFSGVTDENGMWTGLVPALAENALFIAAFSNGEGAVANVHIPDLEAYDRYVVQWKGATDLQIHAFEKGATYDEPGHHWRETAAMDDASQVPDQSFMTQFIDSDLPESLNAEIYTRRSETTEIDVVVEIQVDTSSCDTDVDAQALGWSADGGLEVRDLMIAMPDCGAVGELLVLKNLYGDLTIARK